MFPVSITAEDLTVVQPVFCSGADVGDPVTIALQAEAGADDGMWPFWYNCVIWNRTIICADCHHAILLSCRSSDFGEDILLG